MARRVGSRRGRGDDGVVRYAVVGLGHIAQMAELPAFEHARANSRLVALVSDDERKLRQLARKYQVEHTWDYEQLDAGLCGGQIDAVYIALPNHLHAEYALRAARAGVHVLCETTPLVEVTRPPGEPAAGARSAGLARALPSRARGAHPRSTYLGVRNHEPAEAQPTAEPTRTAGRAPAIRRGSPRIRARTFPLMSISSVASRPRTFPAAPGRMRRGRSRARPRPSGRAVRARRLPSKTKRPSAARRTRVPPA